MGSGKAVKAGVLVLAVSHCLSTSAKARLYCSATLVNAFGGDAGLKSDAIRGCTLPSELLLRDSANSFAEVAKFVSGRAANANQAPKIELVSLARLSRTFLQRRTTRGSSLRWRARFSCLPESESFLTSWTTRR